MATYLSLEQPQIEWNIKWPQIHQRYVFLAIWAFAKASQYHSPSSTHQGLDLIALG
ncbi:uncharacterized protein RSE6_07192 [Rhynchosporium secalis]|uniref:Uncharacterized protein n=1 Tax=Rhynchosporium secalis TaxID=38038 RepID=A0A1E1MCA0_RHYSE|nr:uncharacterized protein RSE6_07192 [Rhynchosporium secalis]